MASLQGTVSAAERSMRSVFVGNIPYEATEEQLKDIFSEVGPVVSFRLVYDRETGKPKGYGFCEYKDQETALSAMRNLNGYELNGRPLRVDNAASEKSKEELKNLQASMGGPPIESPYGTEVEPERAPEAISKAVASLPPEQMFELMKQMKVCIQNNPNEARNMLLQNPQLAYALLQAQVIMRIVEPQVALGLLHRQNPNPAPLLQPREEVPDMMSNPGFPNTNPPPTMGIDNPYGVEPAFRGGPQPPQGPTGSRAAPPSRPSLLGDRPPIMENRPAPPPPPPVQQPAPPPPPMHQQQFPDRGPPQQFSREAFEPIPEAMGDRDMRPPQMGDRDMRQQPPQMGPPMGDRDMRQVPMGDQDLRHMSPSTQAPPQQQPQMDPRFRGGPMPGPMPGGPFGPAPNRPNFVDPRSGGFERGPNRPEDPRPSPQGGPMGGPRPPMQRPPAPGRSQPPTTPAAVAAAAGISPQDQEKAALIMQVLQLSDQQIAMLPPEQRQSILILKEQIARSAH